MKRILILAMIVAATTLARAQDITGNWQGTLSAGGAELRLVLHVSKATDGNLKATIDSIDQPGGNGIPVSSIALKDSKLSFGVEKVGGTYEGKVAANGDTISGTWTQAQAIPLEFKRATAPFKTEHKPAKPSDIDGDVAGLAGPGLDDAARRVPHPQHRRWPDRDHG